VWLPVGDDCAIINPAGDSIAVTTDTLIAGTHFPVETIAADIACKSIAVNLSDLAAMGAEPAWLTLALTLPDIDHDWLAEFSTQFQQTMQAFNLALIGGDTTRGPLSITVQAMGRLPVGQAMQRNRAKPGERIFVTGTLGDAALGLRCLNEKNNDPRLQPCINRLNRPQARTNFAKGLLPYCRCAIDISDGLLADLGHIVSASGCGAAISTTHIPLSPVLQYYFDHYHQGQVDWALVLAHGDDYELCFTLEEDKVDSVMTLAAAHQLDIHCIGEITAGERLVCRDENNHILPAAMSGYSHF